MFPPSDYKQCLLFLYSKFRWWERKSQSLRYSIILRITFSIRFIYFLKIWSRSEGLIFNRLQEILRKSNSLKKQTWFINVNWRKKFSYWSLLNRYNFIPFFFISQFYAYYLFLQIKCLKSALVSTGYKLYLISNL